MNRTPSAFQVLPADENVTMSALQRQYRQELVTKWAWLLEGTKKMKASGKFPPIPEAMYENMAILFENQEIYTREMQAATFTTDLTMPLKYTLPIIRKVYPQLFINKIASIQPLPYTSGGTGTVFYQDFKREDRSPETSLTESDSSYAAGSEGSVPKKIKMTITKDTLAATKDILGATWSTEVQEDAAGTLNIDVHAELVDNMSLEIIREMEQRCIADLWAGASAGAATWAWTVETGYTAKEWYETIVHSMVDAEMLLAKKRYRWADWILCGTRLYSYVRKISSFDQRTPSALERAMNLGVKYEGTLEGRWDVYCSMYMNQDYALMGCYPTTQLDTAFILAPYIPLMAMPLVYGGYQNYDDAKLPGAYTNTDEWSRNVRTRYAKKVVVGDLLAQVTIAAS